MRLGSLIVVLLTCVSSISSQIIELRDVGGKQITCARSGLTSNPEDCSAQSDWYSYVFVGSIAAIKPIESGEKEVRIVPEEVFAGEPSNPLVVQTSQGDCLPAMAVGNRWLFFLRQEKGEPIILSYGSRSEPVADAHKQIDTLRRLQTIGDFAILRGGIKVHDGAAVPNVGVIAHRTFDNAQFATTTDSDGHYEFQPLPPGNYKLTVDRSASFRADDSEVQLSRGTCSDLTLSRSPHGQISGRVTRSDGSPMSEVPVLIVEKEGWSTTTTDEAGHFTFDSLQPGSYTVGIHLPDGAHWQGGGCGGAACVAPTASLYYPGMQRKSDALVIKLATDEKRDDINFLVTTR